MPPPPATICKGTIMTNGKPKFALGQILATPGALEALQESGQTPAFFLAKHSQGDWGEVCASDAQLNDQTLVDGSRLLSAFDTVRSRCEW